MSNAEPPRGFALVLLAAAGLFVHAGLASSIVSRPEWKLPSDATRLVTVAVVVVVAIVLMARAVAALRKVRKQPRSFRRRRKVARRAAALIVTSLIPLPATTAFLAHAEALFVVGVGGLLFALGVGAGAFLLRLPDEPPEP